MIESKSIQYVKGAGPKIAKFLEKLGIYTVEDFLFFLPRAYDDRRKLPKISQLKLGENQTFISIIRAVSEKKIKGRLSIIKAQLVDDSGASVAAVWFNQSFMKKRLKIGSKILVKGKFEKSSFSYEPQVNVSECEFIKNQEELKESVGIIVPIYSLVSGLTQYQMRGIAKEIRKNYLPSLKDSMPAYLKKALNLMNLTEAISVLHFPKDLEGYRKARFRVVFEELFVQQLALALRRLKTKKDNCALALKTEGKLVESYLNSLPYKLTKAQARAIEDVRQDVIGTVSMNRLIQGDVGSGKTEVAVMALLFAIEAGYKGAIMAPTEILAEQHYIKFKKFLEPLGVRVLRLKGKMKVKEKREVLKELEESDNLVVVGTHALIQDSVSIPNLALAIIDEQHRFGVLQRMALKQKAGSPHSLFMTATPIPRSFMLTCYGDLDKTIIDEMPVGRVPSVTKVIKEVQLKQVYEFCKQKVQKGEQIYVVYPLVEESEKLDLKSAEEGWEYLRQVVFSDFKVGILHGRMKSEEKASVMEAFKENKIQILVATTVIEVGIDVPNANTMIIQDAERFGLSQLHQLRGRIGRGQKESFCFLVAKPKNPEAAKRLRAMQETSDGFKIAEYDLNIRGPGEILGTKQSGLPNYKLADLVKDEKILLQARDIAIKLLRQDPDLSRPDNLFLKNKVFKEYGKFYNNKLN
jgi:ATP-dependent DNA helicase RecG